MKASRLRASRLVAESRQRRAMRLPPEVRLSAFLGALIGACVLPLLLLAAWQVVGNVRATMAERDREARDQARNFAVAIDGYLNWRIGALHILAISPQASDPARWNELYRIAQGFKERFGSHVIFAAVDEPMRMLFHTLAPYGAELPPLPRPRSQAAAPVAVRTGKPAVGDTVHGPVAGQTLVAIAVPVLQEGRTTHVLLTTMEIRQFQDRIAQLALPAEWSLSLLDGAGEVIARRAPLDFASGEVDPRGRFVVQSTVSPWSVVLEIPVGAYLAPMRSALVAGAASVLLAVLMAALGGVLAGRRLTRSVAALTQEATPGAPLFEFAEIARARHVLDEATRRRRAADLERHASEARLRATFDLAEVGIAHVATDGRWLDVNRKLCQIVGYARDELVGRSFQDITHPDDLAGDLRQVHQLLAGEIPTYAMEKRYLRKDGEVVWINLAVALARTESGEPDYFISVIEDISRRKRAEGGLIALNAELEQRVAERTRELETAKVRAESADRVKSMFLATMSHELRTPLNSIIGFTGILLQRLPGPLTGEQEKQLRIVQSASRHLLALISDVLDISKVEAGELTLAREEFDLRALVERLGVGFSPLAGQRGLSLELSIDVEVAHVTGDPRRVEQVINNLLANAIKFTPRGRIELTLAREDNAFVVAVADTGVGIRPEDMNQLFRPFSQIETGLSTVAEGTGLGLAISLRLAQAMGGGLSARSEWGKGSRFEFRLPAWIVGEGRSGGGQ